MTDLRQHRIQRLRDYAQYCRDSARVHENKNVGGMNMWQHYIQLARDIEWALRQLEPHHEEPRQVLDEIMRATG